VDRCAAIVSPLRYTQLVTRKRIAIYFVTVWCLSLTTVIASFFIYSVKEHFSHELELGRPIITESKSWTSNVTSISDSEQRIQLEDTIMSSLFNNNNHTTLPDIGSMVTDEGNQSELLSYHSSFFNNNHNNNNNDNSVLQRTESTESSQFRNQMGMCLPKVYNLSWSSVVWTSEWIVLILVAPLLVMLTCDLIVLSIARKQRHRIVMALVSITLSAQATVTRNKGTSPPELWLNRTVPARSRACRAVWEDMITLTILHLPLVLIMVILY